MTYNIQKIKKNNKIVKYLFLSISIITIFFLIALFAVTKLSRQNNKINFIKKYKLQKEVTLRINSPIFEGINNNNLPYKIRAKNVNKNNDDMYNLNFVDADYKLDEGDLKIIAESATLDDATRQFILYKNVQIKFNELTLNSDKVNFYLNLNKAYSNSPVEVNFKNSKIKASTFKTENESKIIHFEGNVISIFSDDDF